MLNTEIAQNLEPLYRLLAKYDQWQPFPVVQM